MLLGILGNQNSAACNHKGVSHKRIKCKWLSAIVFPTIAGYFPYKLDGEYCFQLTCLMPGISVVAKGTPTPQPPKILQAAPPRLALANPTAVAAAPVPPATPSAACHQNYTAILILINKKHTKHQNESNRI